MGKDVNGARPVGRRSGVSPAQALVWGFAAAIALGTLLLTLPYATADGRGLTIVDALFTATSATTVTGLVVVDTGSDLSPFGQAVVLVLIQVGGLGIMTVSTLWALIVGKRITLRERLVLREALGSFSLAGVVRMVRYVVVVTAVVEAVAALLLTAWWARTYPLGRAAYLGVFHAVSAFNNAGFDLFGTSMVGWNQDPFVLLVMASAVIVGGLGVYVLWDLWPRGRSNGRLSLHTKLVLTTTGLLLVAGMAGILALEWSNPETLGSLGWPYRILNAFFHAVTPRTAGFNSLPVGELQTATLFLTMFLMFVGGSPGSTAGGVKTTVIGLTVANAWATITGRSEVVLFERRVPREVVDKSAAIAMVFLAATGLFATLLALTEQVPARDILFETVSALGTVGLSTGITPELSTAGRLWLTLAMFAGRLGPLTLAIAIAQRRRATPLAYPEERVVVG